jgi:hypothetical protein
MLGGSTTKIDPEEVEGLVGYMVRLALHEPTTIACCQKRLIRSLTT